jgi:hypothetical protein
MVILVSMGKLLKNLRFRTKTGYKANPNPCRRRWKKL